MYVIYELLSFYWQTLYKPHSFVQLSSGRQFYVFILHTFRKVRSTRTPVPYILTLSTSRITSLLFPLGLSPSYSFMYWNSTTICGELFQRYSLRIFRHIYVIYETQKDLEIWSPGWWHARALFSLAFFTAVY